MVRRRDAYRARPGALPEEVGPAEAAERRERIVAARRRLRARVATPDAVLDDAARLCMALGADGLRGELTLMRAARALAALEGARAAAGRGTCARWRRSALRHRLRRDPLDEAGSTARVERAVRRGAAGVTEAAEPLATTRLLAAARCWRSIPPALGGAVLRARAGPAREAWLALLARLAPAGRRCAGCRPASPTTGCSAGSISRRRWPPAGRCMRAGLLAEAGGRILVLPMAERAPPASPARLARPATAARGRFALVVLDEGAEDGRGGAGGAGRPAGFPLDLDGSAPAICDGGSTALAGRRGAGAAWRCRGTVPDGGRGAGGGRRAARHRLAARAAAGACGRRGRGGAGRARQQIAEEDVAEAARLVLAPRATTVPAAGGERGRGRPSARGARREAKGGPSGGRRTLEDACCEAVQAALPDDLFAARPVRRRSGAAGAGGRSAARRGRPAPSRRGKPEGGRLDRPPGRAPWQPRGGRAARPGRSTLRRAAAPWRPLRRATPSERRSGAARLVVLPDDFRVRRFVRPAENVLIFVVDASGSAAAARLAEAKGAVELMLAAPMRGASRWR